MHGQATQAHLARVGVHYAKGKQLARALQQRARSGGSITAEERVIAGSLAAQERGARLVARHLRPKPAQRSLPHAHRA